MPMTPPLYHASQLCPPLASTIAPSPTASSSHLRDQLNEPLDVAFSRERVGNHRRAVAAITRRVAVPRYQFADRFQLFLF